ncbi:hypothetical protein NM688_g6958 [Phlebia brevispora]|uniref:Uncharacterized protein n=1 Tax=Phlebia brevispora TaxID=194682 RepID=A0ACC1SAK1_9APHY|nr:hypothetical protein NM688_g6958 [Phlebia brevispora]
MAHILRSEQHLPQLPTTIGSRRFKGYYILRICSRLPLDMSDLALLKISQSVPLHHYPLHALKILGSSLYNIQVPPNDPLTLRYVSLTHTHSRFVLLLQSLAHGGLAFTSEIDADDYALTPPVGPPAQALSGLRELVFPQPLAVFEHADQFADQTNRRDDNSTMERLTRTSTNGSARLPGYSTNSAPHASADFQSLMAKKPTSKKLLRPVISALGGGQKAPPPPPQANPPALAYYVGAWRRNTVGRRPAMKSYPPSEDDEFSLSRPATRRSSSAHPSTASSIASSSPSTSGSNSNGDTDASSFSPRDTSKPPLFRDTASASRPNPASPHDLSVATSRFRAPLLRVFVPCSVLDEIAISMCEEQLVQAGLWDLLSTGDIICNFGFVPSQDSSDSQSSKSSAKSDRDCSTVSTFRRQWLIFNGYCLVHYIPPSPPPIERALTLPSPFYYSHILPANTEPRFVMSLPPLQHRNAGFYGVNPDGPFAQLTLSTARGQKQVQRLGEGWQGEWVLEAEGTQEGKQQLLDAVKPGPDGSTPRGLWEIVRDKSGGGRIWIKLIRSNIDSRGLSSEQAATTPKI